MLTLMDTPPNTYASTPRRLRGTDYPTSYVTIPNEWDRKILLRNYRELLKLDPFRGDLVGRPALRRAHALSMRSIMFSLLHTGIRSSHRVASNIVAAPGVFRIEEFITQERDG